MAWVTAGKEVENYIPTNALEALSPTVRFPPLEQYADVREYLNSTKKGSGEGFVRNKVLFAERVIPHITKDSLVQVLDLKDKIEEARRHILGWNGASPNTDP